MVLREFTYNYMENKTLTYNMYRIIRDDGSKRQPYYDQFLQHTTIEKPGYPNYLSERSIVTWMHYYPTFVSAHTYLNNKPGHVIVNS